MTAVSSKLGLFNKVLGVLGQKAISASVLVDPDPKTPAGYLTRDYDDVRRALMRQHPFFFCSDELPLEMIDPNGCVIRSAGVDDVNGAYGYDSSAESRSHDENDVVVSGSSGAWVIGNAAGTATYYTSADAVSNPWDVARWVPGDDGAFPAPKVYPGQPRGYERLYKKPADNLRIFGVWNPATRSVDKKIRFRPVHVDYVAADIENGVFQYAFDNENIDEWDSLFVTALVLGLACSVYTDVKGSDKGLTSLEQRFGNALRLAKNVDADEEHEDPGAVQGRRYIDL